MDLRDLQELDSFHGVLVSKSILRIDPSTGGCDAPSRRFKASDMPRKLRGEALGKNTSHSARVRMMVKPPFLSSLMSRYFRSPKIVLPIEDTK